MTGERQQTDGDGVVVIDSDGNIEKKHSEYFELLSLPLSLSPSISIDHEACGNDERIVPRPVVAHTKTTVTRERVRADSRGGSEVGE